MPINIRKYSQPYRRPSYECRNKVKERNPPEENRPNFQVTFWYITSLILHIECSRHTSCSHLSPPRTSGLPQSNSSLLHISTWHSRYVVASIPTCNYYMLSPHSTRMWPFAWHNNLSTLQPSSQPAATTTTTTISRPGETGTLRLPSNFWPLNCEISYSYYITFC